MKKYHIIVFGCQMNITDAERVASVFEEMGLKQSPVFESADVIAVVMCSIRQSAVDRVHGLVEKFKKLKKKPVTILTGCVLKKDKIKFVEGFDYVLDIREIAKIPALVRQSGLPDGEKNYLDITPKYFSKFSANVPIMTGCNNFCAYCVVPYTRDREISRPAEEIIKEIKNALKQGIKEIWLLGQNVNSYKGSYSKILKNTRIINFPELLKLVNEIQGEFWVRFTSSHPKDFNNEVIEAMAQGNHITPYLNLPIQSGDNKVLKSMNRHYTVADYKNKIKALRKKIPGIAISTDIIVGFPGETKKQFENTVKLFDEVKYDMAYINKYSSRAGTAAAKLKDSVSWDEKKRREKVLTYKLKETALEKNKKLLNKETLVLINEGRNGNWFGKNEHYKTIKISSPKNLLGKIVKVKITKAMPFTLEGELI